MVERKKTCFFCGSEDIYLPDIGIAFGMGGNDYNFCQKCLLSKSAEQFWNDIFTLNGYVWPPTLKGGKINA